MSQFNSPSPQHAGGGKLVLVALGLALLAVILTNFYIEMVRRQVDENTISVYLLTRSIRPGDRIQAKDVQKRQYPASFAESFEAMGKMDETSLDVAVTTRQSFKRSASQGELLTHRLFEAPTDRAADINITPGKRAITLPVNPRTVPGGLREGMWVDIEAPFIVDGRVEVRPVMEHMKVFALGMRTAYDDADAGRRSGTNYQTITIEVEPQEATQLSMISRLAIGDFELHLRNPGDMAVEKIRAGGINPQVLRLLDRGLPIP